MGPVWLQDRMTLRKLDYYLFRQVLIATLFAVIILCMILVLGNVFKQINRLLVENGLPLSFLFIFVSYVLPFSLVYTVPWGFVTSVVMVFGRLSQDQEISAMKGCGLNLWRISMPVLVLGFGLSLFGLWLNGSQSPRSKVVLKTLVYKTGAEDPSRFLKSGIVLDQFDGQRIFIESVDQDSNLRGFHAYRFDRDDPEGSPLGYIFAEKVDIEIDPKNFAFNLRLHDTYAESRQSDSSFQTAFASKIEPWVLPYGQRTRKDVRPKMLTNSEIDELLRATSESLAPKDVRAYILEKTKRFSFSMAPVALSLIAIPLAMQSRRNQRSGGLAIALGISLLYFAFFSVAEEHQSSKLLIAQLTIWFPNLLCLGLGLLLFHRANRNA